MERGVDVIAQGALGDGEWFGRPDVLRRVERPVKRDGGKWAWSYEVADTKLARETKATTILQLSLYSDLLGQVQGVVPEFLWVVPPGEGFAGEKYRVAEYAAYYRYVKERLVRAVGRGVPSVKEVASDEWPFEAQGKRVASDERATVAAAGGAEFALDFEKKVAVVE